VSWIREEGSGRVFYSSLGHRFEIFTDAAILHHWLAGIQYALGDLDADATPRGEGM
jgi:type 1 glutamine amidotransferase